MRYQGRVSEWRDERGFGFITPNGGGAKIFLHISSFSNHAHRPQTGVLVTYELSVGEAGRPRASSVQFVGASEPRRVPNTGVVPFVVGMLLIVFVAYVAYTRASHPGSTVPASVYKILVARDALRSNLQFQCAPEKSSCSRMSSCAEALFHQERCGVPDMDGDRDGIPCEQQWCN